MKEATEEHKRLAAKHGGQLSNSNIDPYLWTSIIQPLEKYNQAALGIVESLLRPEWVPRPLLLSFVDSSEVNARASPGSEADHVLINRGLIERVFGYAFALFATRQFLPTLGAAHSELDIQATRPCFDQRLDMRTGILYAQPQCHNRQNCAMLIASTSVHLATLHEIGHIVGGHLDLLVGGGSREIGEIEAQRGQSRLSVPLSVVEWDADGFAASLLGRILLEEDIPDLVQSSFSDLVSFAENVRLLIGTMAAHILFRCIDAHPKRSRAFDPESYPTNAARALLFIQQIVRVRRYIQNQDNSSMDREIFDVAGRIEASLCGAGVLNERTWLGDTMACIEPILGLYGLHCARLEEKLRIRESWRPQFS